ncbi:MAG: thioredoxin family protein [Pseudomonadota bacterium]
MRNLFIVGAFGAFIYFVVIPSRVNALMDGDGPFIESINSGYVDIDPEEYNASDIRAFAEPGLITIVEFHDDACAPCKTMMGRFDRLIELRPDVSIKLIHMTKNYYSYWGNEYGLNVPHIPFTILLDKKGQVVAADDGHDNEGYELLIDWINAEIKRD